MYLIKVGKWGSDLEVGTFDGECDFDLFIVFCFEILEIDLGCDIDRIVCIEIVLQVESCRSFQREVYDRAWLVLVQEDLLPMLTMPLI